MSRDVVVLLSGGLDSTVLLHEAMDIKPIRLSAAWINYGQKNAGQEEKCVETLCGKYDVHLRKYDLREVFQYSPSSILERREGEHDVKSDELVNRNLTLISIIASNCTSPTVLYIGAHFSPSRYPDTTEAFYKQLRTLLSLSTSDLVTIYAPFIQMTKQSIVGYAERRLRVPREDILGSVSCYEGTGCGKCPACMEREKALRGTGYE